MLRQVAVIFAILIATGCAIASPHQTNPVLFEVALAGDDSLTQRLVVGLRMKLRSMSQFREANRSPDTLTIVVPNLSFKGLGSESRVSAMVTFSKQSKNGELEAIKTFHTTCFENDLSRCVDQIVAASLRL